MNAFSSEETINGMLRGTGLPPQQFLGKSACSLYQHGISGPCVRGFVGVIFHGSDAIENADVFAFLRPTFDLLSEWTR
jgi:hypothetical protein